MSGLRAHYTSRRPGWQLLDRAGDLQERITFLRAAAGRRRQRKAVINTPAAHVELPNRDPPGTPRVSILIHASEERPLDDRCITFLASNPPRDGSEVLLVLDGATTTRTDAAYASAGVRVLRNTAPLGFARSINRAAEGSVGELILFLDGTSLALPGCIDNLVGAMDDASIGVVGAKITFPGGDVRAAGELIWTDGSRWNIGNGRHHLAPEYNFRRGVDVCSTAALMVRRDVLAAVGFLDEHLSSADLDADLCLAVRALGSRVVLEPSAEVIDARDGATPSRLPMGGAVVHGVASGDAAAGSAFMDKWAPTLRDHHPRPTHQSVRAELQGSSHDPRPRVLVCDWTVPMPDRDAGGQRMDWILRLLAPMCAGITLAPSRRFAFQDNQVALQRYGVEVVAGDGRPLNRLLASRAGMYDLVILSRSHVAQQQLATIRRFQPRALVVFDTVELKSMRLDLQLRNTGAARDGSLRRELALEDSLMRTSDAVAMVSEEERAEVRRRSPESRTVVLPNVHEVTDRSVADMASRSDLIFVGNFTHPPNVDAMQWFSRCVMPLIRARIDVVLRVVGPGATAAMVASWGPSTRYEGWVSDIFAPCSEARVAVAPLRYGAGVKGKIGQALSLGLPVVTTSAGAAGMDLIDGTHALIADDPRAFADAVVRAYNDASVWNRLSVGGLSIAAERWSPDAMRSRLSELLQAAVDFQTSGGRAAQRPSSNEQRSHAVAGRTSLDVHQVLRNS